MDPQDLLITAMKATVVYFFLLLIVRLLGKRSVGAMSAFDLVVALMLGEVVDEAIFGDVTMAKGLLAIVVIALWHFVNGWTSAHNRQIARITEGLPAVLIENGTIRDDNLARERVSEQDLLSQMRLNNIDKLDDVQTATLETNGQVSFIQKEAAKPAQKSDVAELAEQLA